MRNDQIELDYGSRRDRCLTIICSQKDEDSKVEAGFLIVNVTAVALGGRCKDKENAEDLCQY